MPRRARLLLPGVPLHIMQRGNNRQRCFLQDADYLVYLEWLRDYAAETGCRIHAYVLMSNHVHLLISFDDAGSPAALMKALAQRYTQYFNRRYGRSGTLWEGRYHSCLVHEETYFLVCQRYIELNPVRAGIVGHPAGYRWSSYASNIGAARSFLTPHDMYLRLGMTEEGRHAAYETLFLQAMPQQLVDEVRAATVAGFAVGDQAFLQRAAELRRKKLA